MISFSTDRTNKVYNFHDGGTSKHISSKCLKSGGNVYFEKENVSAAEMVIKESRELYFI